MESFPLVDSILAGVVTGCMMLLTTAGFLVVLRAPRQQFSSRFVLSTMLLCALAFGIWASVIRFVGLHRGWLPAAASSGPVNADQ